MRFAGGPRELPEESSLDAEVVVVFCTPSENVAVSDVSIASSVNVSANRPSLSCGWVCIFSDCDADDPPRLSGDSSSLLCLPTRVCNPSSIIVYLLCRLWDFPWCQFCTMWFRRGHLHSPFLNTKKDGEQYESGSLNGRRRLGCESITCRRIH